MRSIVQTAGLMLVLGLVTGCNSSQVVGEWKNPALNEPPPQKLLVLGIGKRPDLRQSFENEFAKQLSARGIVVEQGYKFIPASEKADQAAVEKAVAESGAQAVLMTRLIRVAHESYVSPGYGAYGPGVWSYYNYGWGGYYEPPQADSDVVVTLETTLVDAKSGKLIWSAATRTYNPSRGTKDIPGLVEVLVDAMSKAKVI